QPRLRHRELQPGFPQQPGQPVPLRRDARVGDARDVRDSVINRDRACVRRLGLGGQLRGLGYLLAHHAASQSVMTRAIRGPAFPSHSGGSSPVYGPSAQAFSTVAARPVTSDGGTSWLLPLVIVTGRSVFGRSVRHGTRSSVVSSCTPPESVITAAAPRTSAMNSR